ncbi:MAG: hypothetical protein EHM70_13155 [Chloroflexota bacterium]|nr:MAG: hypothetical protein EHM70_13155 [Chloroflexota bacterium]
MDHIVYVDAGAKELELLLAGDKTMIIRGASGRKMPYGRVDPGDVLYLINNNAEGMVRAKAQVESVFNSDKLSETASAALVANRQDKLRLSPKQLERWSGKRYLVLIEVSQVEEVSPFGIDKSAYINMDDWLPVEKIDSVRLG